MLVKAWGIPIKDHSPNLISTYLNVRASLVTLRHSSSDSACSCSQIEASVLLGSSGAVSLLSVKFDLLGVITEDLCSINMWDEAHIVDMKCDRVLESP